MLRNYFLINLALISIISFLSYNLYSVVTDTTDIPSSAVMEKPPVDKAKDTAYKSKLNPAAFNVISKKDLFRPSRSASASGVSSKNKEVSKDMPKLFGTIIINENKTAILEDPGSKSTKTYRINDSVAGYVITDILEEKVVFSVNGENIVVKLRDDKGVKPASRSVRKTPANRAKRTTPRRVRRPVPTRKKPAAASNTQQNKEELDRLIEEMEKMD